MRRSKPFALPTVGQLRQLFWSLPGFIMLFVAGCNDAPQHDTNNTTAIGLVSQPSLVYMVSAQDQVGCAEHLSLDMKLVGPAKIDLAIRPGDVGPEQAIITDKPLAAGDQWLSVAVPSAGIGQSYRYRLTARVAGQDARTFEGVVAAHYSRSDSWPISQTMVNNVLVWDGHMAFEDDDLELSKDGIFRKITRGYASNASDRAGILGYGWNTQLNYRITETSCGYYVLYGSSNVKYNKRGRRD